MKKTTSNYFKNSKLLLLTVALMFGPMAFAQKNAKYWSKASEETLRTAPKVNRASNPSEFKVFNLDVEAFKSAMQNAPLRSETSRVSNVVIEFPTPEGDFEKFMVSESPMMEQALADKYPMIKTYKAVGIDDPTATMRFSITQFGFHGMILSGKRSSIYIDPYTENRNSYMVYSRSSLGQDLQGFECLVDENIDLGSLSNERSTSRADIDDRKLRTYRLAQSCNGEYGQIFAGTGSIAQQKANVQAQMTLTINRVNEIYERDLAITLIFVANNDEVIYLNPATDPWTGEFNTKTAQTLDAVIGVNNYDIGHNFNTSGGGSAGCLGCVCSSQSQNNFHKGRGYTGRANPTGDAFDIDYVAHEMGHQFNGYHTMNTCSRSGNGISEVEPASGSSIMGYAGICATNVQNNSDAHFNYVNIRDISGNIQTGVSSTCDVETALANQPPVANAGADYIIPKSTAYVLKGVATDPDGLTSLTYNWSQNDPEMAPGSGSPQSTWTQGPLYRSILPTISPNRYMPKLSDVVAGNLTPTWEVTPSVARNMEFAFMVRDNGSGFPAGIGQTDADLMSVTVNGTAGPFVVTSQSATGIIWVDGETETVTWNVAGTDANGINTSNVNILLSTNNGVSFDTVLAANVPNNGSYDVVVPSFISSTARIMVEAVGNIYYAVSSTNFSLISDSPTFIYSNTNGNQGTCGSTTVTYEFNYTAIGGFSETTNFSASGNPAGSVVVFSPSSMTTSGTFNMVVSNLGGVAEGQYVITVTGAAQSSFKEVMVNLTVNNGVCASVADTTYGTSTQGVIFNTISNLNTGKPSGYSDYTAISTDVNRDSNYNLSVYYNPDGNYQTITYVWIDWNQNCSFDDPGEQYNLGTNPGSPSNSNMLSANSPLAVVVPTNATLGNTIMRVTTKYTNPGANQFPLACENGHDAEVEDYTVNVMASLSVGEFTASEFSVYPNPNNGTFNIKIPGATQNVSVAVFDIRGRSVYANDYTNVSGFNEVINLGNVEAGMYLLQVSDGFKTTTKKILVK
ncbi:reprolysin-like metallopeptidase [Bizionia myxarmorum]|uniref:T9SS type A sorting domain-containing protein n=1 Tax=Bizionia myxarmorum TaxID=291186 RepID=A0A5D0RCS5_9FLAO|nr:zinc-dependent metalloprotease family protein [Bizionia myxarmorum]TYB78518.1 T9SS type A sorting domain-containing protein [Bizionia myxarmorum]